MRGVEGHLAKPHPIKLQIQQANCFYNYTVGFQATKVDLLKTAAKFLKSGIARTVCFSDLKSAYIGAGGDVKLERIQPRGRQWDSSWAIKFSENLPPHVAEDLIYCLELSFHESQIEGAEAKQMPPHLRTPLPPLVLEDGSRTLSIYPWLKIYSDGIATLSFQLDTTWENLGESDFILLLVNLFQRYFNRIWVQANIQRMDAEEVLPDAFEAELLFGGQQVIGRASRKLLQKMRRESRALLREALEKDGRSFEIGGESWTLHPIAGSEGKEDWGATLDLCRSIYVSAVASLVVPFGKGKHRNLRQVQLWQGRPSISLLRFDEQPANKSELLESFAPSMSRILKRSPRLSDPPALPPDLRLFGDYSFHGNRALLLWTWVKPAGAPNDAWADADTRSHVLENQARAEHFEYHNLRIARACATAASPPTHKHLIGAYEVLASAKCTVHHSSQAGEITDALDYLLGAAGTSRLIAAGKEQARWHLDERRYRTERNRLRVDRWLTAIFGLVGTAGLADLVFSAISQRVLPRDG